MTSHYVFNGQKYNSMQEVQAAIQGQMGNPAQFAQPAGMPQQAPVSYTSLPGSPHNVTYGAPMGQPQVMSDPAGQFQQAHTMTYGAPQMAGQPQGVSYLPQQMTIPQTQIIQHEPQIIQHEAQHPGMTFSPQEMQAMTAPQQVMYGAPMMQPQMMPQMASYTPPPQAHQVHSFLPPQQPQVVQQLPPQYMMQQPAQVSYGAPVAAPMTMMPGQFQQVPSYTPPMVQQQPSYTPPMVQQQPQIIQQQVMQQQPQEFMQPQMGQPQMQPQQAMQAIVKQEVGPWQICEDQMGDYFVYLPSGQTFDQMPPELMQLLQQPQMQQPMR